jgi:opacity protein-like surface antigen
MRKFMIVAVSLAVLLVPATAEDFPKAEVFAGYQFAHLYPALNASGWNAAVTGNINRWMGVTADFSGLYKSGGHIHTYMFGPVFSARSQYVTPFVHALFGGANAGEGNAFSMALGGGLDANAGEHFAIRLVQADWILLRSGGITEKTNARVSAGLVFRF